MPAGKTNTQKAKDSAKAAQKQKPSAKDMAKKKATKGKKKRWSKTKTKERANNAVFFTKSVWDKLNKDVIVKEPYITPGVISDKLKLNVSICRQAIKQLIAEDKLVNYNNETHNRFGTYVKSPALVKEIESKPVEVPKEKKKKGGK